MRKDKKRADTIEVKTFREVLQEGLRRLHSQTHQGNQGTSYICENYSSFYKGLTRRKRCLIPEYTTKDKRTFFSEKGARVICYYFNQRKKPNCDCRGRPDGREEVYIQYDLFLAILSEKGRISLPETKTLKLNEEALKNLDKLVRTNQISPEIRDMIRLKYSPK